MAEEDSCTSETEEFLENELKRARSRPRWQDMALISDDDDDDDNDNAPAAAARGPPEPKVVGKGMVIQRQEKLRVAQVHYFLTRTDLGRQMAKIAHDSRRNTRDLLCMIFSMSKKTIDSISKCISFFVDSISVC